MEKTCFNCGTPITKEYCEGFPEVCEHWTQKKPQTNADRIRAMSDEELVAFAFSVGPVVGIDRETAKRIKGEDCFIPLHKYENRIEPVKGEIGAIFGTRVYVKDGDNDG